MMIKRWTGLMALLLLGTLSIFAQEIPKPVGFVNDYKGLLNESQVQQLDQYLTRFAEATTNEISVAILDLPQDETPETYTYKVATSWGVFGAEGKNNGILLAIYPDARKVRIEVGYALEPAIPDLAARRIIEQDITPYFRQNNYYEGIRRATEALATLAQGEIDEATRRRYYGSPASNGGSREAMGYIMLAIIIVIFIIIAYGKGGGGGGGGGRRGKGYYHGGHYMWWGGSGGWGSGGSSGGGWGGGGGGGGFGGFGGGGGGFGGFGGGGASGGW